MSKIPTIKEFLEGRPWKDGMNLQERIYESMIEFAKLHVEAALEEAKNSLKDGYVTPQDEQDILNAYPLTNIK